MRLLLASSLFASIAISSSFSASAAELKIHAINVGWGQSVLIEGPNGTKLLLDSGLATKKDVVINYLKNRGIAQLDHFVLSHNHADHGGSAEFVVRAMKPKKSFYSGSKENISANFMKNWFSSYKEVAMPAPTAMPLGYKIDLGDGATATAVAADCKVMHQNEVIAKIRQTQPDYAFPDCDSENDASIVMLIKYKGFDYLVSGDLGGHAQNGQSDFETPVITSLLVSPLPELRTPLKGIDVLHLGHHGSRTSTNQTYVDMAGPEVALVSVGPNQSHGLPNQDAILPLLDKRVRVLQTDEGKLRDDRMFAGGFAVGHITISTDGNRYTVGADATGLDTVSQPQVQTEAKQAGLPLTALVDGGGVAPAQDKATPSAVASLIGTAPAFTLTANVADDVGVIRVEFLINGVAVVGQNLVTPLKSGPVTQSYNASALAAGKHTMQVKATDASGKTGVSQPVGFSIAGRDSGGTVPPKVAEQLETNLANDTRATAAAVLPKTNVLVGYFATASDNEDWYALNLAAGQVLNLGMTGPTASGQNYDLSLHNGSGVELAKSAAASTTESLKYTNGNKAATVYLRVIRVTSYSRVTPYRVEIK